MRQSGMCFAMYAATSSESFCCHPRPAPMKNSRNASTAIPSQAYQGKCMSVSVSPSCSCSLEDDVFARARATLFFVADEAIRPLNGSSLSMLRDAHLPTVLQHGTCRAFRQVTLQMCFPNGTSRPYIEVAL